MKLRHRWWSIVNRLRGFEFGPVRRFRCCGHTWPYHHTWCSLSTWSQRQIWLRGDD